MRARDAARLSAIRLLLAALKQREVDERIELSDADVVSVIEKMIKQRRESIAQFEKAARNDLVEAEKFEIEVLSAYLPRQMSDAVRPMATTRSCWRSRGTVVRRMLSNNSTTVAAPNPRSTSENSAWWTNRNNRVTTATRSNAGAR